jgi:hypothetical protein
MTSLLEQEINITEIGNKALLYGDKLKVLVACEYSGVVRDAFSKLGHYAVSCDLLPTDSPGHHYQGDLFDIANSESWDLIIAHPPCTHLCVSGNRYWAGTPERIEAAKFVYDIWNLPVDKLCIENPVGVINTLLPHMPKPQYIQPYQFGHPESKKTGLWTRGLQPLVATNVVSGRIVGGKIRFDNQTDSGQNKLPPTADRWKMRSRTYEGIAEAMANQWGIDE